jgi:hypothetical protein
MELVRQHELWQADREQRRAGIAPVAHAMEYTLCTLPHSSLDLQQIVQMRLAHAEQSLGAHRSHTGVGYVDVRCVNDSLCRARLASCEHDFVVAVWPEHAAAPYALRGREAGEGDVAVVLNCTLASKVEVVGIGSRDAGWV